jgi:hypothetical protein
MKEKVANRTGRDFGWEMISRGRFATPADFPPHDCSAYPGLYVRRENVGVVHRPRATFVVPRAKPYPSDSQLSPPLKRPRRGVAGNTPELRSVYPVAVAPGMSVQYKGEFRENWAPLSRFRALGFGGHACSPSDPNVRPLPRGLTSLGPCGAAQQPGTVRREGRGTRVFDDRRSVRWLCISGVRYRPLQTH